MAAAVIGLNWIDLICTLWALRLGCVELNPLMQSVTVMLWHKAAAIPALVLWLKHCGTREARRGSRISSLILLVLPGSMLKKDISASTLPFAMRVPVTNI